MTYDIAIQQKMITFRTLAEYENKGLTPAQRLSLTTSNLDNTIYNRYNSLYNSVTYAYAQARSRALKDTNKLLTSNTIDSGYIYVYKVLVDKGSNTKLDNSKEVRDEYNNFTNIVNNSYRTINKKYYRSTKELTIQVSNTATEHAFRDNFTSILLHSHALLLTNNKTPAKELEKIISKKLPTNYNVKIQVFNSYKSNQQLVITSNNRNDPQVIQSLTNWLNYIYKTVAQKPFKNYKELQAFEKLPLEQRYNLIRVQQLITKGIRKHKSLTIHFPSTKKYKVSTKYLTYIPIVNYDKENTYNLNINNINSLTRSNTYPKAHTALFTYIANYLTITNYVPIRVYNIPFKDTG